MHVLYNWQITKYWTGGRFSFFIPIHGHVLNLPIPLNPVLAQTRADEIARQIQNEYLKK